MIFSGPSTPKLTAEAWVVSENVGDGGPGEVERFGESNKLRSELFFRGMTATVRQRTSALPIPFWATQYYS